jgi:SAM-dependent methyltransferase
MALRTEQDAFGRAFLDHLEGRAGTIIIERDDGFIDADFSLDRYFDTQLDGVDIEAMRFVRGRVLDVGCGAGRHSLYLQETGHEVVGIDESPGAIECSRTRGVRDVRLLPVARVGRALGLFDTAVMMGNNLGLLGSPAAGGRLLRRLRNVTEPGGRIVGTMLDPHRTDDTAHLGYHARNRARGRPIGQIRIRIRYRDLKTPWLDLLWVSADELREVVHGTGWVVAKATEPDPVYVAVLERT